MKKIFTLFAGLLMTVLVFAADRGPTVAVKNMSNFKIVIDGRAYFANRATINLRNLHDGRHTIQVFEMRRSLFGRNVERMISSTSFRVKRNDMLIRVNYNGQVSILERKNRGREWNDRDFDDRDFGNRDREYHDRDRDYNDRDRGYDRDIDRNRF